MTPKSRSPTQSLFCTLNLYQQPHRHFSLNAPWAPQNLHVQNWIIISIPPHFPPSHPFFLLSSLISTTASILVAQVRNLDVLPDSSVFLTFLIQAIINHCHAYILSISPINACLFISIALLTFITLHGYTNLNFFVVLQNWLSFFLVFCHVLSENKFHEWRTDIVCISHLTPQCALSWSAQCSQR